MPLMVHSSRPFLALSLGATSGHPSRRSRHTPESQTRFVSRIGNVSSATDQLSPIGPKHEGKEMIPLLIAGAVASAVAMTAVFAQSESNSIRCWTTEIVNERYPFTNSGNTP
jgi:hypothetical protein